MADTENVTTQDPESTEQETTPEAAQSAMQIEMGKFIPGQYAPFDWSSQPIVDLPDNIKNVVRQLVILASRRDVASRRFEVEQRWEERLFQRGYQHLLPRRGAGGWSLPGEKTVWGPLATADSAALYSTNIIGRDRDILCAAIAREVPKVNFFPRKPEDPASMQAADAANNYKYLYEKSSDLRGLLMEAADLYLSDERVLFYTRHVKDAESYGIGEDGKPNGCELTDVYGVLEHKVPMQVQKQAAMDAVQVFTELDIAVARAKYPWAKDKIQPGSTGIGEIELDMIARVNTRLALLGSYVTGDALQRDVTEQLNWFRPQAYFDDTVDDNTREWLLKNFPKGMLVVYCGPEFMFARNESMDEHLFVSHALPGIGQNRRGPQSSEIPIQKRLNAWIDLFDAYFRRTVPRRIYNAEIMDMEALRAQDNVPGKSTGALLPPGGNMQTDVVTVEPTPTHQPAMLDFVQSFFGEVAAALTGASDALFNASSEDEVGPTPVGTIKIRRDQALARAGLIWNAAKIAFAAAAEDAAMAAADCRTGTISDVMPDTGESVTVNAEDLKGGVLCYPEYDAAFPESWSERETRYRGIIDGATQNPFYQAMIKIPKNLRVMADAARMSELSVPGEDAVKKQLMELEQLTKTGPIPSLAYQQVQAEAEQQAAATGGAIPPEVQQQIDSVPQQTSSIDVAKDASEDHETEALTCFEWMNDADSGLKYKNGTDEQQAAYENVHLHWQAHMEMAKKLTQQAPAIPPIVRIGMKDLPPGGRTQAAAKVGIMVPPKDFENEDLKQTQHKIAQKVVPKTVPETYRKLKR